MGNPVITRLGRNQFWYKKWYTDLNYNFILKKIFVSENIILFFLRYGLFFKNNIFRNQFWYKNNTLINHKNLLNIDEKNLNLYFRKYYYSYKTLSIEHSYHIRLDTPEFFSLRLYVIKYNNWVVVSLQWFKPSKHNLFKKNKLNLKLPLVSKITNKTTNTNNFRSKR